MNKIQLNCIISAKRRVCKKGSKNTTFSKTALIISNVYTNHTNIVVSFEISIDLINSCKQNSIEKKVIKILLF